MVFEDHFAEQERPLSAEMVVSKEIVGKVSDMCCIVVLTMVVLAAYGTAESTTRRKREGTSRSRPAPCPVDETAASDTGPEVERGPEVAQCVCAPGGDIRCHGGVQAVPKLVVEHLRHADSSSFAEFYASSQEIGGIPAFAFADLSVDRIVLNFNPIGHRQANIEISHCTHF